MPAQSVVITSLATDMRIAPTPWSPIPRICGKCQTLWVDGEIQSYLLAVTDDYVVNILSPAKVRQTVVNRVLIIDVQETTLRFPEESRVILNGITLCRRVDDTEHFLEVCLQQL